MNASRVISPRKPDNDMPGLQPIESPELLAAQRQVLNARQMADLRGISPAAMRQRLAYYGIQDPRERQRKARRELLRKLWLRGEVGSIAEYMGCTPGAVLKMAKRMKLSNGQVTMQFDEAA